MSHRRILFVDDEPKVLQGLRRMLRSMRGEWETAFADGGQAALDMLARQPFDVVVSDMRMPGMDGAQLLTQVRQRYPHIVRIVLSGHSEKETVLRSVGPAHQYLAKPCDAETLKRIVGRACALRDVLADERLRRTVSSVQSLPSLPQLYLELETELESADPSIKRAGEIISRDVGMAAKMLQLVNSAFFGLCRHVCDPSEAAKLLGLDTLRALVLSVHVFSQLDNARTTGLSLDALLRHSTATGTLAKRISAAERCQPESCDHALMAGLLHDAGRLLLAASLPDRYREALRVAQAQAIPTWQAEREVFGASHAEVGAYLLGVWGLPDPIVEALAFHHRPSACLATSFTPLTAVHAADALDHETENAAQTSRDARLDAEYLARLGLAERVPAWRELCTEDARHGVSQ